MDGRPRFIADVMLGTLAKWLRIVGFDTLYFRDIADNELVRIGKQEERIFLTRDRALCRSRRSGPCLLIVSERIAEQMLEVLTACDITRFTDPPKARCPRCNGEIAPVSRDTVQSDVPEHVLCTASAFARCGICARVYWEGTHTRMIAAVTDRMLWTRKTR